MEKEYKDCFIAVLSPREVSIDREDWTDGVVIPFKYVKSVFTEYIHDGESERILVYVEDTRTGEKYFPEEIGG